MTHPTDPVAAMREACAKACENHGVTSDQVADLWWDGYRDGREDAARAIRALPLPAAPAHDAVRRESASAEAMRVAWALKSPMGRLYRKTFPTWADAEDAAQAIHDRDGEGARPSVVPLYALPLPARREESRDAVVEAARVAVVRFAVEARNHGTFPVNECGVIDQTSAVYQSYIATLADLWRSVDAYCAALRGTRPEGHEASAPTDDDRRGEDGAWCERGHE